MAGGEGSRLRPLTCDRPKPLVPVLNKPIMEYGIELLKKHGISDIGVTLQYLPDAIIDYFGDGSKWGVNLHYFLEEVPLGTAGSVKNAEDFLDEPFMVISGDALTDFNLSQIMSYHLNKQSLATIVLTVVSNPLEYGIVITDSDQNITSFLEKPGWGEVFSDTVNTGIYVFEPEILKLIPRNTVFDFSKDLFPKILAKKGKICGYNAQGYWCDIGNINQYRQSHIDILSNKVQVSIPGTQKAPGIWVSENCQISENVKFTAPVFIDSGVTIEENVFIGEYSVIGKNSILRNKSSLKRAILWDNVYIGKSTQVRGALLLKGVKIKNGASLFEGVVVGDDSIIEENSTVKPDVKIWPNKLVERESILCESLVWGTKSSKRMFGREGISGDANIDVTPDFAAKLGTAYASLLPKKSRIIIGSEISATTLMIKDAFCSGVMSGGIQVIDIAESITPVTRFAAKSIGAQNAVHIKCAADKMTIMFFNEKGANISREQERKIENAFKREDFHRVVIENIQEKILYQGIVNEYFENVFSNIDEHIGERALRIVVDYSIMLNSEIMEQLLQQINAEVINYNGQKEMLSTSSMILNFVNAVKNHDADFGIIFDAHGEYLTLVDSQGKVITMEEYNAILTYLMLSEKPEAKVVVPFHAPSSIEKIAKKYSSEIIFSKTSSTDWMKAATTEEIIESQGAKNQFSLYIDALRSFVFLTDYLARHQIKLEEILAELPNSYYCKKEVHCPWDKKGVVMRSLIEEGQKGRSELLDGIKIYHDDGWALVLPDSEEALCRVYSEGRDMETAEELAGAYLDKVKKYRE